MRKFWSVFILFLVMGLGLAGCGSEAVEEAPTAVPPTSTVAETEEATAVPPTIAPEPTEAAEDEAEAAAEATAVSPAGHPSLFDAAWEDREIFRAGLVSSEQAVLGEMPGAPVYHMKLQIEDRLDVVSGRQEIRYTNQELVPLDGVYFHLFPNLLGGEMTVETVTVNGEAASPSFEEGDTVMWVPLAQPLQPGEGVTVGIDFVTAVPTESGRNYGILAYVEDVLALAHFYPMLAVYDDEGWNIEPAAESGDVTYADAAYFLVEVTAPAEQVVIGSGIVVGERMTDGAQTLTFAAGPGRDFYLASSDQYAVLTRQVGEVVLNSYAPADREEGAALVLDYLAASLATFNENFGHYPYTELDVVSTPTLALGVEYPGIFVNTLDIYDLEGLGPRWLESTTVHEMAHQWFYNMVGNDQLDEPWLDESVTQYATWLYFFDNYGEAGGEMFYDSLANRWQRIDQADIPIGLPVEAYEGAEYSGIVYGRGPIFVLQLAEVMGEETFDAFMFDYVQTYKWEIAATEDFRQMAESYCECDLTPLFEEWVYAQSG